MQNSKFPALPMFFILLFITMSGFYPSNKLVNTSVKQRVSQTPVSIDMLGDGSFVATGGLEITGVYTMDVQLKGQSRVSAIRCSVVLYPSDNSGTINIKMNCQFSTNSGQWQIVGGTGDYTNLKGNGSLDMIGDAEYLDGKIN